MKSKRRGIKELLFGNYDYGALFAVSWPFCRSTLRQPPTFFGTYASLGILTAAVMGLQHALAMVGGLITPPLLVGLLAPDTNTRTYLIQASLLVCGITTAIQVTGPRFRGFQIGSGILSVMGVSFTGVPVALHTIGTLQASGRTFDEAYGAFLGTVLVCSIVPALLSFLPYRALRRVFPPIVTGTTIILIGTNLVASGFKNWGGGNFCGDNYQHSPNSYANCLIPLANGTTITATCFNADAGALCSGNGDVLLPFGSAQYIGLGLLVLCTIIITEIFGSPFMRNAAVVLGLLFGFLVAAVVPGPGGKRYFSNALINNAPAVTFLWVKRFPFSFHPPAVLPLLIVFCITSIETIGDVTATEEASRLDVAGEKHTRRVRASLFNDGVSSLFAGLAGSMPLTTYAQNNGVIALTAVASRQAGWAAACWLFLLGLLAKFGAWVLSIPNCVLGGMLTFLFANVVASGIKILVVSEGSLHRRNRFILAVALAMGYGVTLVPQWASNNLWPADEGMSEGVAGVREAILLIIEEGFVLGTLVAIILNQLLPREAQEIETGADLSTHEGPRLPPGDASRRPPRGGEAGAMESAAALDDSVHNHHRRVSEGLPKGSDTASKVKDVEHGDAAAPPGWRTGYTPPHPQAMAGAPVK